MLARPMVSHVLHDEALTRHLNDPEARLLVEWLVERAEQFAVADGPESERWEGMKRLCRRARGISRFVALWCHDGAHGAAIQLAGSERFDWPLPPAGVDPCDLMQSILSWESRYAQA